MVWQETDLWAEFLGKVPKPQKRTGQRTTSYKPSLVLPLHHVTLCYNQELRCCCCISLLLSPTNHPATHIWSYLNSNYKNQVMAIMDSNTYNEIFLRNNPWYMEILKREEERERFSLWRMSTNNYRKNNKILKWPFCSLWCNDQFRQYILKR